MVAYKTLVLGASTNPERYSYQVVQRLVAAQIPVVPMGVKKGSIGGIPIVPPLAPQTDIHTVSLYLAPARQQAYFDFIIQFYLYLTNELLLHEKPNHAIYYL